MIGAKWWWVSWSSGVVRWLGPRGGGDLQVVILLKKQCSFSTGGMGGGRDTQPLINFVY